jgi:hypothetical protein
MLLTWCILMILCMPDESYPRCCSVTDNSVVHAAAVLLLLPPLLQTFALGGAVTGEFLR